MEREFIPIHTKHITKELEKEVNIRLGLQPICNISTVLNLDEYQENEAYKCAIRIAKMEFLSNQRKQPNKSHLVEKIAEEVATRNAYFDLLKRNWKVDTGSRRRKKYFEKEKLIQKNVHKISGAKTIRDGFQSLVNMGNDQLNVIYECGKYMSDEVFAMQFKDLVRHVTKDVANAEYIYTTRLHQEGDVKGYTSVLDFNGRKFESLGLMVDESQAEQSAAEVCLRTLRFIPDVAKGKFLIQPYQGGLSRHIQGITVDKPYIFTSRVLYDVLEAFLDSRNMQKPRYFIKTVGAKLDPAEFTMCGEIEQNVDCICYIYGKFFKAPVPHILRIATQLSANEALDYFGVSCPQERMELRKHIRINRYSFSKAAKTAFTNRPSICTGWIWPRFCRPESYGDTGIESLLESGIIMNNLPAEEYMRELVRGEMERIPSYKNQELIEMTDLSVAEVNMDNPNLFTIGNSQFSIKVLIEDGKIYSTQRTTTVDILPGHNIRKLRCEYRVSLPSLDIHLKAIDCNDLYYSNPPLPVVTSCGVVVLFHDFLASREDVFVLVRRRASGTTLESKVHVLQGFLQTLIQPNSKNVVTPADCTEGIEKWLYEEVKLLSDMKMDSLCTLMSTCTKYDTRWNELLARGELAAPLKELQDICLHELKRREDEGLSEEDQNLGVWELPQSEFVSRFDTIGIHLEGSMFCGIRALAESAGISIGLADIESCPTVDVPLESDKEHRGDVSRYYIAKEINEGSMYGNKPKYKEAVKGYQLVRKTKMEHGTRRYQYISGERKYQYGDWNAKSYLMSNIEYVNADGSRTKYVDTLKYRINEIQEKRARKILAKHEDPVEVVEEGGEEDANDAGNSAELPPIPLPEDPKFESYQASLQNYCVLKELSLPLYNQVQKGKGSFSGIVSFSSYFFCASKLGDTKNEADEFAAREALVQLGYLKRDDPCEEPKLLTEIHLPGDVKFTSYKSSLHMLCVREKWGEPKYSFKKEYRKRIYHGSVVCGKLVLIAKKSSSSMKESSARAAYEALRQFGYLKGVEFEYGFTKPPGKDADNIAAKETETIDESVCNESNTIDSDSVVAKESGHEDEGTSDANDTVDADDIAAKETETIDESVCNDSNTIDSDSVVAKESGHEDECMSDANDTVDPYSILAVEPENPVDSNPEADEEEPDEINDESRNSDDGDVEMKDTEVDDTVAAEEDNSFIEGNNSAEFGEGVTNGENNTSVNEWARDDDVLLENRENVGDRNKSVNQWAMDDDVTLDDLNSAPVLEEEMNKKVAKRKRYRMNKLHKRMKIHHNEDSADKGVEPSNQWGQHGDVRGWKRGDHEEDKKGEEKGEPGDPEEDKNGEEKVEPDMTWKSYGKRKKGKKPEIDPPLPARDAYREQCIWMKLDEAINVCPMLIKVSQTSQFQEQFKKLVEDANKLLESKGFTETVKSSLLPDE